MSHSSKLHHDWGSSKKSSIGVRSSSSKLKSKYESIEPKINSGYHVGKLLEDFDQIQKSFRFKPDEIFPRIKISVLVSLISESVFPEKETTPTQSAETEEKESPKEPPNQFHETRENLTIYPSPKDVLIKPYLLLDVRDSEQFKSSHIITAVSYPKTMLSRGNFEISLLLKYRNHKEYIIIVYDENETTAPQVATTLIERGYNNVFMLSGGLRVAKQCFPHSLVVHQEEMTVEISRILVSQLQQMSFRYRK